MMVFESACVSSHIQDKEKVAAAVTTSSVFLLMLVMGSQLLSDTSTSSGAVSLRFSQFISVGVNVSLFFVYCFRFSSIHMVVPTLHSEK